MWLGTENVPFSADDVLFKPPVPWMASAKPGACASVFQPAFSWWEASSSARPLIRLEWPQEFGLDGKKCAFFTATERVLLYIAGSFQLIPMERSMRAHPCTQGSKQTSRNITAGKTLLFLADFLMAVSL